MYVSGGKLVWLCVCVRAYARVCKCVCPSVFEEVVCT